MHANTDRHAKKVIRYRCDWHRGLNGDCGIEGPMRKKHNGMWLNCITGERFDCLCGDYANGDCGLCCAMIVDKNGIYVK